MGLIYATAHTYATGLAYGIALAYGLPLDIAKKRGLTMFNDDLLTSADLLKLLKLKENNCTEYRLAKILRVTHTTISNLLHGQSVMGDETAYKVAIELGYDPVFVLFCINIERAKTQELKELWQNALELTHRASLFVIVFSVIFLVNLSINSTLI